MISTVTGGYGATLPSGFVEQQVGGTWNEPVGVTWAADGRMFVWERSGRVWTVNTNGVKSAQPLIDIRDEVGGWRDYGLLGFALHPNFLSNGHIYLLYVVDHHHLIHHGTSGYNPNTDEYFMATTGRITRYTARAGDNFNSVDYSSRKVLVGESITNGFPILHQSHGTGSLVFGTDGTLLAASGDGASYSATDTGGSVGGSYASQALSEGIITAKENIGALRSQLVDSLAGKVIRIDPETGDGIPSNPFYDAGSPRAPRSRMWAMGLRNPYRMTLRPGTGSHNPADANPGVLYIGDVGWAIWEDLHVCTGPGQNFGWPLFEGMEVHTGYYNANVYNLDAPNPLYNGGGCSQQYFYFRNLLVQETLNPPSWPNPCNSSQQIPSSIPRFMHSRPAIDWRHGSSGPSRTGGFNGGNAVVHNLNASGSPVPGPNFGGNASTGGTWYQGTDFPSMWRNTYFHGDYGESWIKNFAFDANNKPTLVRNFLSGGGGIVFVATHPTQGGLYYARWNSTIWKISYVPGGNQPPVAVASADKHYGPGPLAVQFAGINSYDPDGATVSYTWNFGDGTPNSTAGNPSHVFNAPGGVITNYTVTLVARDSGNATATNSLKIHVNNSPPNITITSPTNGTLYPMSGDTIYPLTAAVTDAEHSSNQLSYAWVTTLFHNNHSHDEPVDTNGVTTTQISPLGCGEETYFYGVTLTVTDAGGLSGSQQVFLYPACPPPSAPDSLAAVTGAGSSIDVSWVDTSSSEQGFKIERSLDGTNFIQITTTGPNATSYADAGLLSNTQYFYRARAFSGTGDSAFSNVSSASTQAGGPVAFQQDSGPDGLVVMEAENYDSNTSQGGKSWTPNSTAGFSGTGALAATPNSGVNNDTGYVANSPRLDFKVNFVKTGTHHVWVRGIGPGGSDDSCHVGLNGAAVSTSDRISSFNSGWSFSKSTMDGPVATINIPNAGVHTVNVWMREDGFIIDKLVLTVNSGYTPSGAGPAGSPRNSPATPPTISSIADQVIDEGGVAGPINFMIDDAETYPDNLLVSAGSSNTNLAPNSQILLDGSGANRMVTLTPVAGRSGETIVTLTVSDGATNASTAFLLSVLPVNDSPIVTLPAGILQYSENDGPVVIDTNATVSDVDSANFGGGSLVVEFTANGAAEDRLSIRHQGTAAGQVGVAGNEVSFGGSSVGILGGGTNGSAPLLVSFNSNATPAAAQAVLRNVTYENVSDLPSTLPRSLAVTMNDGDGGTSAAATMTIHVMATPDLPNIVWTNPAPIVYGTMLGATQLNASADVTGVFAYNPASGAVLNAGTNQLLSASFTPDDATNYTAANASVFIDILPASLTITADDKSRSYGTANPTLTASYSGWVNGDTEAALAAPATLSTPATPSSPVGEYPISPSGGNASNYTVLHVDGVLTVTDPVLPELTFVGFDGQGNVTVSIVGEQTQNYRVLASTNFVTWETIATVQNVDGTITFIDTNSAAHPQRFYRVLLSP